MISPLPGGMDDTGPTKPGEPNPLAELFDLVETLVGLYESKPTLTLAKKIPPEIEALRRLGRSRGPSIERSDAINALQARFDTAKKEANKLSYPIKDKFYSHSSKEGQDEDGIRLGFDPDSDAFDTYRRTGYEIDFDVLVYEDGTVKATHVNGMALVEPVEI